VGRVHEIPGLDTWVLREPENRPWDDADRWRRIEDTAGEAERRWRALRVRLHASEPEDARILSAFRRLKAATISLATGASGVVERARAIEAELADLLLELRRQGKED
jgi:hypothetical protein